MSTELIIFSVILVASVIAHYCLWRSSMKRYSECIKQAEALTEQLRKLEAGDEVIDGLLDEAESRAQKMDDEINALRLGRFLEKGKADFVN